MRKYTEKRAEQNKKYLKNHYKNNKPWYLERNKKRRYEAVNLVNSLKNRPCADCGGIFPIVCMDFDHKDNNKENCVSKMARTGFSIKSILKEISKCDLICANCHRIRTQKRLFFSV